MNSIVALVRREFWEHRSLWIAPLVAAGVLILLSLYAAVMAQQYFGAENGFANPNFLRYGAQVPGAGPLLGLALQIFTVTMIAVTAYLLDCLYAERKDRSILFWKSLPVSDARTVLVKYGVAMLVTPLGALLLAMATFLLVCGIFALLAPQAVELAGITLTSTLQALGTLPGSVLVTLLWYAPLAALLMLVSVVVRRSPWLIAVLLPVGLVMVEGLVFRTRYVASFLGARIAPVLHPLEGLQRPGLWLGLAVAAGMLYSVVRLRRYRDDT
jgi:ABC-2 type transport system permease protein